MHNTHITYTKDHQNKKVFTFEFHDLDSYRIKVELDSNNQLSSSFDDLEEIARLLNAINLFRQWNDEQRYYGIEIRHALESIAKKNDEDDIFFKEYRFAMLGSANKIWKKIIIEK